jgi:regulatory protein
VKPNPPPEALAVALRLLATAERFTFELSQQLQERGFDPQSIAQTVSYLQSRGIVDDQRALEAWVQKFKGSRASGQTKISQELKKRGATEDWVEQALNSIAFQEDPAQIDALLAKRMRPGDKRAKIARFLAARGFSEDSIEAALSRHFSEQDP